MDKREKGERAQLGRVGERPFWVLGVSIVLRAVHQVGAAVYLVSFLVPGVGAPPAVYLVAALASGAALVATESMRHRQLYREVAGLSTLVKLVLLGAAYHGYLPEAATVLAAFLLASVGAHLPKNLRHRRLF